MTEHFNKLTPAEAERLSLLLEECGEVVQIIGKILRHGYESSHPLDPSQTTNREMLERELGDLFHVVSRMIEAEDVCASKLSEYEALKAAKIASYLHHQD